MKKRDKIGWIQGWSWQHFGITSKVRGIKSLRPDIARIKQQTWPSKIYRLVIRAFTAQKDPRRPMKNLVLLDTFAQKNPQFNFHVSLVISTSFQSKILVKTVPLDFTAVTLRQWTQKPVRLARTALKTVFNLFCVKSVHSIQTILCRTRLIANSALLGFIAVKSVRTTLPTFV